MHKKILRKQLLKILLFIMAAVGFPTIITLIMNGKIPSRIYSADEIGKLVILDNDSVTEKLDVENFIPCAIMGQLSIDNDEELLKSFAVIMRTYILSALGDSDSISCEKLNIPYITYDEMENLWGDDFPDNYNKLMKVISDTSMQTITCQEQLISPYYHSVSAGKTRNGAEVMGDSFSYLCSVSCPGDTSSPEYFKAYYYTNEEFAKKIRALDKNISIDDGAPLQNIQIVSRDSAGYVLNMEINGTSLSGIDFYEGMAINSPSFMIEEYDGGIRITTYGAGHGLGLSLCHAAELASGGSSYIEILNSFYTNVEIK